MGKFRANNHSPYNIIQPQPTVYVLSSMLYVPKKKLPTIFILYSLLFILIIYVKSALNNNKFCREWTNFEKKHLHSQR